MLDLNKLIGKIKKHFIESTLEAVLEIFLSCFLTIFGSNVDDSSLGTFISTFSLSVEIVLLIFSFL